jgi:chemotaxis protein MotB
MPMSEEHNTRHIIKRIKKHGNKHHGGSWKLAYADFVTAMMAFFLLMWLLSMLNKYQLEGIAKYFQKPLKEVFHRQDMIAKDSLRKPETLGPSSQINQGSQRKPEGQLFKAQQTIQKDNNIPTGSTAEPNPEKKPSSQVYNEPAKDPKEASAATVAAQAEAQQSTTEAGKPVGKETAQETNKESAKETKDNAKDASKNAAASNTTATDQKQSGAGVKSAANNNTQTMTVSDLEKMKAFLDDKLNNDPHLSQYKNQLNFKMTSDGLKIEMRDLQNKAMFSTGKTDFQKYAKPLMTWLSNLLNTFPNRVVIIGHTDSTPYKGKKNYSNWELSADRANATRRALIDNGMDEKKVMRVIGVADTSGIENKKGEDAANRRIEIIVLTDEAVKKIQAQDSQ